MWWSWAGVPRASYWGSWLAASPAKRSGAELCCLHSCYGGGNKNRATWARSIKTIYRDMHYSSRACGVPAASQLHAVGFVRLVGTGAARTLQSVSAKKELIMPDNELVPGNALTETIAGLFREL